MTTLIWIFAGGFLAGGTLAYMVVSLIEHRLKYRDLRAEVDLLQVIVSMQRPTRGAKD